MATFKDLSQMKNAVIEEYGKKLSGYRDKHFGSIAAAIETLVFENYDDLPEQMPGEIRDGIADYAKINRHTFQTNFANARGVYKRRQCQQVR
ncbi:MAG: hypothetical protein LBR16_03730 [Treponema sp.]|nr:hypothetical protein [Treponema sp.]